MAAWGGVLAGLGFGIAIAFLMRVIEQASPEEGALGIGGEVFGVLTLGGLVLGIGLGMAFAALIPDAAAGTASTASATVTDEPAAEPPGPGN
jgi:hypothetical protein